MTKQKMCMHFYEYNPMKYSLWLVKSSHVFYLKNNLEIFKKYFDGEKLNSCNYKNFRMM